MCYSTLPTIFLNNNKHPSAKSGDVYRMAHLNIIIIELTLIYCVISASEMQASLIHLSLTALQRCRYKTFKQRMRLIRPRLKLGVVLHADMKVAVSQLYRLDKPAVGGNAAECKSGFLHVLTVVVVKFVTVTVALRDIK